MRLIRKTFLNMENFRERSLVFIPPNKKLPAIARSHLETKY